MNVSQSQINSYGSNQNGISDGPEISEESQVLLIHPAEINQLYIARDRLRQFANQIKAEKYTPVRQDVLDHCEKINANKGEVLNYDKIEKMVKNRIQKMVKNKKIKKNWGQQDILILVWVISKYADLKSIQNIQKDLNNQDWSNIAQLIPGVKGQCCMFKWLGLKKSKLSDHSWSQKQSSTLSRLVRKYGQKQWGVISQKLYFSNNSTNKVYRCPKQCRQRWSCYLNPNLKKGPWQPEQDWVLLSEVRKKNGQKKWTQLSKFFDGRTENALKNRYNLIIDKQIQSYVGSKKLTELELIDSYLQKNYVAQFVSSQKPPKLEPKKKQVTSIISFKNQQDQYHPNRRTQRRKSERRRKIIGDQINRVQASKAKIKCEDIKVEDEQIMQENALEFSQIGTTTELNKEQASFNPIISFSMSKMVDQAEDDHRFNIKYPQLIFQSSIVPSPNQIIREAPLITNFLQHNKSGCQVSIQESNQMKIEDKPKTKSPAMAEVQFEDMKKIKMISVEEGNLSKFQEILLSILKGQNKQCSIVPCLISENKLTKYQIQH